ncbi:unnamed protein product [Nippostrongylus brasiliensis]|uniref:ShKT domain-containing protein n=1 Tax=Nippostrongylus brasiliensis TaxID=27835 RepID=A0A0N4YF56_NIPBR|nr:unnamed protein product [Nippostrongylus brasiliensis]
MQLFILAAFVFAYASAYPNNCYDTVGTTQCSLHKAKGHCQTEVDQMQRMCPWTCGYCDRTCGDELPTSQCQNVRKNNICGKPNEINYYKRYCGMSCFWCEYKKRCYDRLEAVPNLCWNYKQQGQCTKDPSYMLEVCAKTCGFCK